MIREEICLTKVDTRRFAPLFISVQGGRCRVSGSTLASAPERSGATSAMCRATVNAKGENHLSANQLQSGHPLRTPSRGGDK